MTLLLTRSKDDATPTLEALGKAGQTVLHEPLLKIVPGPDAGAEPDLVLDGVQALMATSANAVRAIRRWDRAKSLPLYAVGPRTAKTARDLGFSNVEQAGGDVEALAKLVQERRNPGHGPVLHLAGKVRAGDLKGLLEEAGFSVKRVVLYEAVASEALSAEARAALQSGRLSGVLLYSPRTAEIFSHLVAKAGLEPSLRQLTAYCLSDNVAKKLAAARWAGVKIADRPEEDALLALLPPPQTPQAAMSQKKIESSSAKSAPKPTPKPAAKKPPKPGRTGWRVAGVLALVLIGLVGGLVVVGSLPTSVQARLGIKPVAAPSGPSGEFEAIDERLAALEAAKDSLPVVLDGEPGPDYEARFGALEDRLAAVEARPQATVDGQSIDLSPYEARLEELSGKIAALAATKPVEGADPDEVAALREELTALSEQVARNRTLSEEVSQKVGAASQAGLAFAALERAANSGEPFSGEVGLVTNAPPAAQAPLEQLARYAGVGVPTKAALKRDFPALAGAIVKAGMAGEDTSWLGRIWRNIRALVVIRPVGDVEGGDPGAIVARAEVRLEEGALGDAVDELAGLKGPAAEKAADWLAGAKARLAVDAALDDLRRAMIAAGGPA